MRHPVFMLFALLLAAPLLPAAPRVLMQLSQDSISLDQGVQLILQVESNQRFKQSPRLPFPDGILHEGTSQSIRHTQSGRQLTAVAQFIYNLRATRTGTFTIGPYTLGGQTLPAVTLTVTPGTSIVSVSWASQTNLLVQESFDFHFTLESPVPISNVEISSFEHEGLEVSKLNEQPVPDRMENGRKIHTFRFGAKAVVQRPGPFSIQPVIQVSLSDGRQPMRHSLFAPRATGRRLALELDPITGVGNRPPREGQPEDYSGAIGSFGLTVTATPSEVHIGDPITLNIQLVGQGNMRSVLPPTLTDSDDFQVYAPKLVEERLNEMGNGGYKTYEQVVAPRNSSVIEIPALRFNFFDPKSMTYKEVSKGPFPITVKTGNGILNPLVGEVAPAGAEQDASATLLGRDLLYLKSPPRKAAAAPLSPRAFSLACATPLALYALGSIVLAAMRKRRGDPARLRQAKAPKALRRCIARLAELEGDPIAFHDEIWNGLHLYFGDRFGLEPGDISPENLEALLGDKIPEELARQTRDWFDRIERARFGVPAADRSCSQLTDDFVHYTKSWEAIR